MHLGEERAELRTLARSVAEALGSCCTETGDVMDPVREGSTPPDHYTHTFTALALQRLGDARWSLPLRYWRQQPVQQRGHAPFNRLALRLLEQGLKAGPDAGGDRSLVVHALEGARVRARYDSNNWTLLAAALDVVEAPSTATRTPAVNRLLKLVDRWTTESGAFIDFPSTPRHGVGATPVTYHSKALFCVWLARRSHPDPRLDSAIGKLLSWLTLAVDSHGGWCGGLGRSSHALFSDAALLVVVLDLLHSETLARSDHRLWLELAGALRERLVRQRRSDGLLWLTPACASGERGGWDGYMYLTVYNAWFAGLILSLLEDSCDPLASDRSPFPALEKPDEDTEAGLARVDGARLTVRVVTRGQPPQGYGMQLAECRYAGGLPWHVSHRGRPLLPTAGRIAPRSLLQEPWRTGWSPLIQCQGQLYGAVMFERVVTDRQWAVLTIEASGAPAALTRPDPRGVGRMLAAADWRLFGGRLRRRAALQPQQLPGHIWYYRLWADADAGRMTVTWTLEGLPGSQAYCLNLFPAPLLRGVDDFVWRQEVLEGEWPDPVLVPSAGSSALGDWSGYRHEPMAWPTRTTVVRWCLSPRGVDDPG